MTVARGTGRDRYTKYTFSRDIRRPHISQVKGQQQRNDRLDGNGGVSERKELVETWNENGPPPG